MTRACVPPLLDCSLTCPKLSVCLKKKRRHNIKQLQPQTPPALGHDHVMMREGTTSPSDTDLLLPLYLGMSCR